MKSARTCALLLWSSAFCQQPALEVVSRIGLGELPEAIYRASVCPGELVLITNDRGDVTIVDGRVGTIVYRATFAELSGAVGNACDEEGRLYISASPGLVRVYTFSTGQHLILERTLETQGSRNRLLAVNGQLYITGLARVGTTHVFLRRFKLPEGIFLGSPRIELPVRVGDGFNLLATEGVLFWHPARNQVVYLPSNPLAFWRLDTDGSVAAVERPNVGGFVNVAAGSLETGLATYGRPDRVRGAAALPDGSVVVQAVTRSAGGLLQIFDRDFRPLGSGIPLPAELGYLVGAGSDGALYFADFAADGSSLTKVRVLF
jgi:hypothetical protein